MNTLDETQEGLLRSVALGENEATAPAVRAAAAASPAFESELAGVVAAIGALGDARAEQASDLERVRDADRRLDGLAEAAVMRTLARAGGPSSSSSSSAPVRATL